MELKLEGKRALVTGSSSGIGAAIATALAAEGATVVITGRNVERAQATADAIGKLGHKAVVVTGDLTTEGSAVAVAEGALRALGGIDILVNNAGGTDLDTEDWTTSTASTWRSTFDQNLFSAVYLTQALLPSLRALGWGRIINVATAWATQPAQWQPHYSAAKAGLVNASVSLARALAGTGVTVNTVSPGPVLTPTLERVMRGVAQQSGWGDDWAEIEKKYIQHVVPLSVSRLGRVEDIAHAIAFLASPLADFINGANLRVDGGHVTSIN